MSKLDSRVKKLEERQGEDGPPIIIICWHGDEPCNCGEGADQTIQLTWGDVDEH